MLKKEDIIKRLSEFVNNKVDEMSINNSIVMVFRPVIHRVTDKMICKVDKLLSLIADENGMIDIDAILGEMVNNLITAAPKSYPDVLNGLTIGNGKIVIDVPIIDKDLVLTKEDIEDLRHYLAR